MRSNIMEGILGSTEFDRYFKLMWNGIPQERRSSFAHIDALCLSIYEHGGESAQKVLDWISRGHWRLLILCKFNQGCNEAAMLLLDSLQSIDQGIQFIIRSLLLIF